MKKWISFFCVVFCLSHSSVFSETISSAKKPTPPAKEKRWTPSLTLGADFALSQSSNVPGVQDGLTFGIGVIVQGGILFKHNQHSWNTTLKLVHRQSKTPILEFFTKTADDLEFNTEYKYSFKKFKKASFFAAFQANTPLLFGWLVVSEDKDLKLLELNGSIRKAKATKLEPFEMTTFLTPLILQQKAGFSIKPVEDSFVSMDIKLSVTAQETFASGYSAQDDATTPEIELKALQNFTQVGAQFRADIKGNFNKRLSYEFYADMFYPFFTSVTTPLEGFDAMVMDLSMKLSLKLLSWASIDYVFRAQKIPLLTEKWQVLNNLLFTIKTNIF